jgi:hypothetical protein
VLYKVFEHPVNKKPVVTTNTVNIDTSFLFI